MILYLATLVIEIVEKKLIGSHSKLLLKLLL